jgi:hypothetical protein
VGDGTGPQKIGTPTPVLSSSYSSSFCRSSTPISCILVIVGAVRSQASKEEDRTVKEYELN